MTTSLVVDASLTLNFLVPGAAHAQLYPLFEQWQVAGVALAAPTLWAYEMTSNVNKLVHFGLITAAEGNRLLKLLPALNVQLVVPDDELRSNAYRWTRQLNRAAAYDSFYLALAERLNCDFWTADQRLVRAVNQPWVKSIPL
ncbi:MAG: type II toxin-antitoxin system VapC family toxin [Anaerolineales bacterium]|nr:type II toxin-antitoxin system VapC family toxin [Anaerolineales bacterium]